MEYSEDTDQPDVLEEFEALQLDLSPRTVDLFTGGWEQALTRRMRVLLHTAPLMQIRAGDSRRDVEMRHYDSLALSMKTLDVIAEQMGLEQEADRGTVERALSPLLCAMDVEAGVEIDARRHLDMVDKLLAGLRNDAEARRPFTAEYTDFDEKGRAVKRRLDFRLVHDAFGSSGSTVLRLTHEAVNLFFNALELDLEDAQAATEAIVQSQLVRGRFDEAVRSAQYALRQSRLYSERLGRVIRDTRRDIGRVDWLESVPVLIDDAMTHLEVRLDNERDILDSTHTRLDDLTPGSREAQALARVARLLQRCIDTHTVLQRGLMTARTTFLDSQARQAFVASSIKARPELPTEVLLPTLLMAAKDALDACSPAVSLLSGAQSLPLPSLASLIDGLLRPKRQIRLPYVAVEPVLAGHLSDELVRYSPETRVAAATLLTGVKESIKLSELLTHARAQGHGIDVLEVLILLILQSFGRDRETTALVSVEPVPGLSLIDEDFLGDELLIGPAKKTRARKR